MLLYATSSQWQFAAYSSKCCCWLCSISGSVQHLRFSAGEQPPLQSQQQQQQQDTADVAGGRAECTEGGAVRQPLSPAEPQAACEAEQPDMPAAAAAYSSDDDGGGYDGGDWGGDSDAEAAPAEVSPGEPYHNLSVDKC